MSFDSITLFTIIGWITALVISISLHEMMHAYVGHLLGDDTAKDEGRLTINPLAHISLVTTVLLPLVLLLLNQPPIGAAKPVPLNPRNIRWGEWGMALVALAGPLTNLLLAILAAVTLNIFSPTGFWLDVWLVFISINFVFFLFNMLPIPPLDGSRVLYVFMPDGIRRLMITIERMGIFVVLAILFLLLPIISPLIQGSYEFFIKLLL